MKLPSKPAGKASLPLHQLITLTFLGALLVVMQVALSFLPNIELVSVLLIVYTRVYGWKVFYPLYIFVALEGLLYGFSTWFMHYLYVWAVLVLVVLALRRNRNRWLWVLVNTAFGLSFGGLCALTYFFLGGATAVAAYWVAGIPFDLLHMGGNFLTTLLLCEPLTNLLTKLKQMKE